MSNRLTNIVAALLLLFVFLVAIFSMKDDSATMDEVAHLPAGYSYLTQKDMRLNPEHPPLLKDLAAFPLLFIKNIHFPAEIKDWKEDVNGQWGFGYNFLYKSGNPADLMIFWGRIPMILVLILLGFYIFKWSRELFGPEGKPLASYGAGNKAALLALFLFSFSPTFLAHGRLVTTDVGAAAGVFIASYYFLKALRESSKKNIILAGVAFGLAELTKFSVILLIPFFGFLSLVWWLANPVRSNPAWRDAVPPSAKRTSNGVKLGTLKQALKVFILVMVIGFIVIWPFYQYHVLNYPAERQARDTQFLLNSHPIRWSGPVLSWAAQQPILRPYAQYFLGLFLVFQRARYGNTTYFLGEVSATGWKNYFPVVYAIKETLVFHILTIIALLYAAWTIKKPPHQKLRFGAGPVQHRALLWCWAFWVNPWQRARSWIENHFPEFSFLVFIGLYWAASLSSNLNIGVRHLLPVFPFIMILVAGITTELLKPPLLRAKYLLLAILVIWQASSILAIYPHFLAYFNELAGGPDKAFVFAVDSNLDWGQDLKRLEKWVQDNKVNKIYVDYFGGGDAKYYLKEKYSPWRGTQEPEELPKGSYLAVSATFLQGGRGLPVPGFNQSSGYYLWLDQHTPIAKIGYSIFVYYID